MAARPTKAERKSVMSHQNSFELVDRHRVRLLLQAQTHHARQEKGCCKASCGAGADDSGCEGAPCLLAMDLQAFDFTNIIPVCIINVLYYTILYFLASSFNIGWRPGAGETAGSDPLPFLM